MLSIARRQAARVARRSATTMLRWCSRRRSLSVVASDVLTDHPDNNVSPSIAARVGTNLHLQEDHPLNNIKHIIESHFNELSTSSEQQQFKIFDGQ